ncbi:MAG: nucleoside triphosphate pyrophosphohydrolase family protein [Chloroflexota bacterium]
MSDLTFNKYQELALRTASVDREEDQRKIIAALGLAGEAGEFANLIKKLTAHGHAISTEKLVEELGDVLWYLSEAASACGLTLDNIAENNIAKLVERYPDGFSHESSINRKN